MQLTGKLLLFCAAAIIFTASPAAAYIGPGMGAGAVAVVFGVIASVFLAIFAVLYYPIKRLIKKRKTSTTEARETTDD